jgi:hypothetical protein
MRKSSWTPSIVPRGDDHDIYLVVDNLGRLGWVWRETEFEISDFETVILDLLGGQYKNPIGYSGRAVHAIRRGSVRKSRPPTQLSCHLSASHIDAVAASALC